MMMAHPVNTSSPLTFGHSGAKMDVDRTA